MTTEEQQSAPTEQTKPAISKAEQVRKLLSRTRGATIDEIIAATTWKPHSVRAFLSGIRKSGATVAKEERKNGAISYRIVKTNAAEKPTAVAQVA